MSPAETEMSENGPLQQAFERAFSAVRASLRDMSPQAAVRDIGTVFSVGQGTARASGLASVESEELLEFADGSYGVAFNIDLEEVGVILLNPGEGIVAGTEIRRTGRVQDTPVGEALLGRVIDPLGRPLDQKGPLRHSARLPVERPAPRIMDRAPVTVPLQTGIKVIDALIPIGRGQRELLVGDRQSGKTALAIDAIINQRDSGVICIFCAIGKRGSDVVKVIDDLTSAGALDHCVVVVATEENPPGLQYVAPYAATTIAEYFMEKGKDVLIIYDDLTRHARAYRELSLLLRRPPGREAFPGDIFYIHSRLLERSTHLNEALGGGSLTALPIVETEAEDISAYIPTNLISITDGQVFLSATMYGKGLLPAVDVGKSVSRVGGKTQLPAYHEIAGGVRLYYSQFEELETFSRFGSRLDEATQRTLDRGRRLREVLKQPQYKPISPMHQILGLFATLEGLLDSIAIDSIGEVELYLQEGVDRELGDLAERIQSGASLTDDDRRKMKCVAEQAVERWHNEREKASGKNGKS